MHELASVPVYLLILFNLLFFWELYSKPFTMATGELLSTFFPTWVWQGRQWAKWGIPKHDHYYWLNTHSHPVLSSYYPVSAIVSFIVGIFQPRGASDKGFCAYVCLLLAHWLFGSIGYYLLLTRWFVPEIALLGAIAFTYQAFHIRQQPCLVYTIAWFPWIGVCPWLAVGMILLAGYYPLALYLLPLGLLLNHDGSSWLIGLVIGSVQLVPFLRYLPKTIRANKSAPVLTPPWEKPWYFGLLPIMLVSWRHLWLLPVAVGLYLCRKWLPRVPWRAAIILTYGWIALSLWHLSELHLSTEAIWCLVALSCLDLWLHNRLIPTRPWCELYLKPSRGFNNKLVKFLESHLGDGRVSGLPWPLFTGMINEFRTLGYNGGMQLKLMAKFRHDPDGTGNHDWFKTRKEDPPYEYRVKFAYSRTPIDWPITQCPHLYRNPAF